MPLQISRIKALCFDVDGTLRDTDDQYVARLATILRLVAPILPGRDADKAARWLVMRIETPANFLFGLPDRIGLDDEIAAIGEWFYHRGVGKSKHEFQIIPEVESVLAALSSQYPISIVTARGMRGTKAFLDHFNIGQYFDHIAAAQTVRRTKPHPAPIHWAAEQMGVAVGDCLMIGDTTVDIIAGRAAGAQTIGVLSGFGEEAELLASGAELVLGSVAELPELLLSG